jgi:hydroxymethylglutaryl-CoA synthase
MTEGPVAIVGVGVGVPDRRLDASEVAAAWGRKGRGQAAVCGPDEDTLTLAWSAAVDALAAAGTDPADVDGMWWGTTRPPFGEGPSWTHLAATLRLGHETVGGLSAGSAHAGVEALLAAADAIAAGTVQTALVVASDALVPGPGSGFEPACGAGAAAVVLTPEAGSATIGARSTRWMTALDRYRGDQETETRETYDGRLFREEVFLPTLTEAASGLEVADGTRWSLPDPDGRLGGALAKKIGAADVASADGRRALGELGASAALVGLAPAFASAGPAALVAYGGGRATAVAIDVSDAVPGAEAAVAKLAAPGAPIAYAAALRARGQLVPNGESVEMAIPPGSAMFVRDNPAVLGLIGNRCVDCGTVAFPPSIHPTCPGCGGAKAEPQALSRTGTVQTYVVNHAMPAPFVAPLPLVCVDLDDGSRVMFQGAGPGEDLAIGAPVELILRRYSIERGVPIYGWKVRTR